MLKNEYLKRVLADVEKRDAGEPEFLQAVTEVFESLEPVIDADPRFEKHGIMERIDFARVAAEGLAYVQQAVSDMMEKTIFSETEIQAVIARSKLRLQKEAAPKVLFLRASASAVHVKNSEGVILGDMLKNLGCVNIADSDATLLENVSIERILEADPDHIFVVQQGDNATGTREYVRQFLEEHPAWAQLTAVKNGRVHFMEKRLFGLKPNHRWGQAYAIVEDILNNE